MQQLEPKGQLISELMYEVISKNTNKKLSGFLPSLHRAEILTIFCILGEMMTS